MQRILAWFGLIAGVALAAFFAYYSIRLAIVWSTRVASGKTAGGMYIGAVAFPVLTVIGIVVARRAWRVLSR